jgi:hypothetical protein
MGTFGVKNVRIQQVRIAAKDSRALRKNTYEKKFFVTSSAPADVSAEVIDSFVSDGDWISRFPESKHPRALETLAISSLNPNTASSIFSSLFGFREACVKPPRSLYAQRSASVTFRTSLYSGRLFCLIYFSCGVKT